MPDHDDLFKELLRNFLFDFLDLFMPKSFISNMDKSFCLELNTELPAVLGPGKSNRTDLVFEIRNKQFRRSIVHIEVESSNDSKFADRMFYYYGLLRKKYNLPVLPIAIFSFKNPLSLQSSRFVEDIDGIEVARFEFQLIQLNQWRWRDFLEVDNPIVSALVACMACTEKERPEVKLKGLCHLASQQLSPEKALILQRFNDAYLDLAPAEKIILKQLMTEIENAQQEAIMTYLTSWERDGMEKGRAEGLAEGLAQGEAKGRIQTILRQLSRRFGLLDSSVPVRIQSLDQAALDELAEALLDFASISELISWLDKQVL